MPLSSLANDNISLLKKDGSRVDGLNASVQKSKIFMDAGKVLVESGDLVLRHMSNGAEETYEVIDPCFYEKLRGISAHYQMDVKKLGLPDAKRAVQNITYNVTGNNARINNHSIDASTNVVNVDARVFQHVQELRDAVSGLDMDSSLKSEALEVVGEIDAQLRSGKPKKSVVSALLKVLPHAANIATIGAAILDFLA